MPIKTVQNLLIVFIAALTTLSQAAAAEVTFNKDIAPLLFNHCAGCHRPNQSAPFSLLTFQDASKRAKQIAEVVRKKYMPPWLPEKGHGDFANDRSLSPDQIDLIQRWVAGGALEGVASDLPPPPKWSESWQLGTPDLIVKLPQAYTLPAEGKDVYRNFVTAIPVSERKYVRAVELNPGNWKVVHHAFINVDFTSVSRRRATNDPPGFDGMNLPETATMPGGQSLSWQPGKVPSFAQPGLAWTLPPHTDLVLQMHLHPTGKPEQVQPSLGFYFTDQAPTNTPFRVNLNPLTLDIPPGVKDYVVTDQYVLPIDVDVIGVLPHAHYLGKQLEGYALLPNGSRQDLLLIKDWDFNWQGDYSYAHSVFLPKGSTLAMRFSYDNSTNNLRNPSLPPKRVKYGLQTTDEMAELWFQVLPRNPAERNVLGADFSRHLAHLTIDYNEFVLKETPGDFEAHTRAGRAQLFLEQFPEAVAHLQKAVQINPSYDRAWYELGYFYLGQERLSEAQQAFQTVVRLNPQDYQAEGSLGSIFMKRGDLGRAESHLRAALRLNPQDSIARQNLERVLALRARQNR